jgi:hypothetical protein
MATLALPGPQEATSTGDAIEVTTLPRIEDRMSEAYDEESFEARIERLGRERPKAFKSLWAEVGFVFTISMSQVLTVSKGPQFSSSLL